MKIHVIGKKTTKDLNGNEFYKLYCTHKVQLEDSFAKAEGRACSALSVQKYIFDLVELEKDYLADYDKDGKLLDFEAL